MQKDKPLLEQWLDDYWRAHAKDDLNIYRIEKVVHNLIFMLLEVGDEQLNLMQQRNALSPLTGLPLSTYETVKSN